MFALALTWARRSTCDRLRAGAVAANDQWQVVAAGYNGAPRGFPHCDEVGHLIVDGHCQRTLHAEWNLIIQAARVGVALQGTRIFVTARPCQICAKMLVQAGVSEVHYWRAYNTDGDPTLTEEVFQRAGVPLVGPYAR
jgi:dCMP deaminase